MFCSFQVYNKVSPFFFPKNHLPIWLHQVLVATCRLSSPTRDQTHVLYISRQTPDYWTTRDVPESIFFQSLFPMWVITEYWVDFPVLYSKFLSVIWAYLRAQLVQNPSAMQETLVHFLGREDPLEKGRLPTPVFWPGEFHGLYSPWGRRVGHHWVTFTINYLFYIQ